MTYTVTDMDEKPPTRRMAGLPGRFGVREAQNPNGEWWPVVSDNDRLLTRWAAIWVGLHGPLPAKLIGVVLFGTSDIRARMRQVARGESMRTDAQERNPCKCGADRRGEIGYPFAAICPICGGVLESVALFLKSQGIDPFSQDDTEKRYDNQTNE